MDKPLRLTLCENHPIATPVIGHNLFALLGEEAHMMPSGMTARAGAGEQSIVFALKGTDVLTLDMSGLREIDTIGKTVALDAWREPLAPDLQININHDEAEVYLAEVLRDDEVIGCMRLKDEAYGIELEPDCGLDQRCVASIYNHFALEACTLELVGGVTLIDGLNHVSGTKDSRLMGLLARMDAQIEAQKVPDFLRDREARRDAAAEQEAKREARRAAERERESAVENTIDDFFQP